MSFARVVRAVPDYRTLPTLDELTAQTQALRRLADPLVRIRTVGHSRDGYPIELISVGTGAHSALLVGTPHPNEPIGCLTTGFLIECLRRNASLRDALGFTWHVIRSIEPDGLRLNEGWLSRPLDLEAYLMNFFRPAFDEQAEYTFPLSTPGYRFDKPTPENLAWQEAMRLTAPRLMVSLHNAEHGGAFYIVCDEQGQIAQRLAPQLAAQPPLHGVPLDDCGELLAELPALQPGVFRATSVASALTAVQALQTPARHWTAGESSLGFGARTGTFGLVIETPYWTERILLPAMHRQTLQATFADAPRWAAEAAGLLGRHVPALAPHASGGDLRLLHALEEAESAIGRHGRLYAAAGLATIGATAAVAQRRMARLAMLRPVAMLRRLAASVAARSRAGSAESRSAGDAAAQALDYLRTALAEPTLSTGMQAVSLQASVRIQVDAILTTAAALKADRGP